MKISQKTLIDSFLSVLMANNWQNEPINSNEPIVELFLLKPGVTYEFSDIGIP